MTDTDRLAELRDYLDALYGKNVAGPTDLIDIRMDTLDWLIGQAELADELGDLLPKKQLEIDRFRGLLARLEWIPVEGGLFCPACSSTVHSADCWLAKEIHRQDRQ